MFKDRETLCEIDQAASRTSVESAIFPQLSLTAAPTVVVPSGIGNDDITKLF